MHFYSIWININSNTLIMHQDDNNMNIMLDNESNEYLSISLSAFIANLKYYSIIQLTNDWLHLRQYHWTNIAEQHSTRNTFESVIGKCSNLETCSVFARVNRQRNKYKNNVARKRLYFIKHN